jgi:hypothetical protein
MNMKKLVIALILVALIVGSVSALDWQKYPDAVKPGNWLINAGIGFGTYKYGTMAIPPLSVSVDYALPLGGLPFSVGGMFGFSRSDYYGADFTYLAFGGRFGYHPDFGVANLDPYAVVTLGYYHWSWSGPYSGLDDGSFLFGGAIGARYFFIPNVGAFAELGYSALSFVTLGVTFKL